MELKNFSEALAWCEEGLLIDSKEKKLVEMRAKADKLKVNIKAAWHLQCLSLLDPWKEGAPSRFLCSVMSPARIQWWFHVLCVEMCRGRSWTGPKLISPPLGCQGRAVMGTDLLCVTTVHPFLACRGLRSGMPGKQR